MNTLERTGKGLAGPIAADMANTIKHKELFHLNDHLDDDNRRPGKGIHNFSGSVVIGSERGLRKVMEMVRTVAPMSSPVLLLGETGVGKEVIAGSIHHSSPRCNKPMIRVNCGAIPEGLIDSELFGHEKGAFTGALARKSGRFERAHGGTLFLDEVGELSLAAQVRLLRVLQDKKIERVGGTETLEVDVRIITATNRNMSGIIKSGKFREDLWFRLNVFPIKIPPLRHRKYDIPELVHHFIDRKTKELNLIGHPVLAPGAMEKLQAYDWPGNVRELENIVERALIRHQAGNKDLPLFFENPLSTYLSDDERFQNQESTDYHQTLDDAIRAHIKKVLEATGGRIQGPNGAAAILGLHPSTLRSRMRKLGLPYGKKVLY